jgi:hypothetical protein
MLKGNRTTKLVCSVLALAAVMPAAVSQAGGARNVISARHLVEALMSAGVIVRPAQIELLSGTSNIGESAKVRVVSVNDRADGSAKVKLRCQDNHECLPFYILVHGLGRVNGERTRVHAVPVVQASSLQNVIRGGDHATLILESADSRMSLPVICLQSGVRGQRIRVSSTDHRQFFDAEVVATGMVKGSL